MASEVDQIGPRGWYPDPDRAGRERWWTGAAWSRFSHRAASTLAWWPATWSRLFWAGPNRWAFASEIPLVVGMLPILGLAAMLWSDRANFWAIPLAAPLCLATVALGAIAIALGVVGLVASRRHGAVGLASCSIVAGALFIGVGYLFANVQTVTLTVFH